MRKAFKEKLELREPMARTEQTAHKAYKVFKEKLAQPELQEQMEQTAPKVFKGRLAQQAPMGQTV